MNSIDLIFAISSLTGVYIYIYYSPCNFHVLLTKIQISKFLHYFVLLFQMQSERAMSSSISMQFYSSFCVCSHKSYSKTNNHCSFSFQLHRKRKKKMQKHDEIDWYIYEFTWFWITYCILLFVMPNWNALRTRLRERVLILVNRKHLPKNTLSAFSIFFSLFVTAAAAIIYVGVWDSFMFF